MVVVAALILGGGADAVAANGIECGGVVGPGGVVTLSHNILNCDEDPALTVVGPVTFNMNGFLVTCGDSESWGILIEGEEAVVSNGTVQDCGDAFVVWGDGGHQLTGLLAQFNGGVGFQINSDFNTLTSNQSNENDEGYVIVGNNNTLTSNRARGNDDDGFDADTGEGGGSDNTFLSNVAEFNGSHGFELGGENNFLRHNVARGNGNTGFFVPESGRSHFFEFNLAFNNDNDGFEADGGDGTFRINLSLLNGGDGIDLDSGGNSVTNSLSFANDQFGNGNTDMDDGDGCFNNFWSGNFFGTSNDSCIN